MSSLIFLQRIRRSTVDKRDEASSGANNLVYSFNDIDFGTEGWDRYLALAVSMGDDGVSAAATAVEVAGEDADEIIGQSYAASSESIYAGLWLIHLPTGTSGNVTITGNTTMRECGFTLYKLTGIKPTPRDTDLNEGSTNSLALALDVQRGDIVLACASHDDQASGLTFTNLTEDNDFQVDNIRHGAAHAKQTADESARDFTITSGGIHRFAVVAAAFPQV